MINVSLLATGHLVGMIVSTYSTTSSKPSFAFRKHASDSYRYLYSRRSGVLPVQKLKLGLERYMRYLFGMF